jgi:hypothetical protein
VAGGGGGTCIFIGGLNDPTFDVECTLNPLAADNSTAFNNADPNTATLDADTARITIQVNGTTPTAGQTITYSGEEPTCQTPPGPCVSGFAGGSNLDGGSTLVPSSTDTILTSADIDNSFCTDQTAGFCTGDATVANAANPAVTQDLSIAGGWTAVAQYVLEADGNGAVGGAAGTTATASGSISTGSSAVFTGGNVNPGIVFTAVHSGGTLGWTCNTNQTTTSLSWTCSGPLAAGDPEDATSTVRIGVAVSGVGGASGETITFLGDTPTCVSVGPCDDGIVSRANTQGGDTTPGAWPTHTDVLVP